MDTSRQPAGRHPLWALAVTSVGFFMVTLDALVVITALPALHRELGGDLSTLDWTVNAYLLSFAAAIVPAAALGDRHGRRRVYVAGLLLFAAASAACATAPSIAVLMVARALQGLERARDHPDGDPVRPVLKNRSEPPSPSHNSYADLRL